MHVIVPDKIYKVILLGDPSVGKTSIRKKYFGESFQSQYISTLGADFALKTMSNKAIQIWDIGGQPSFAMLHKQYFLGAHGAIVAFDITKKKSLENLTYWFQRIADELGKEIPSLVVANKIDLVDNIAVGDSDIEVVIDHLSTKYQQSISCIRTSAISGENIDQAFIQLINTIDKLK